MFMSLISYCYSQPVFLSLKPDTFHQCTGFVAVRDLYSAAPLLYPGFSFLFIFMMKAKKLGLPQLQHIHINRQQQGQATS